MRAHSSAAPFDAHPRSIAQRGCQATRRALARGASFIAPLAGNDTIAFGALKALNAASLRGPHDVAVVGYDDTSRAALATPPLTTMRSNPIGHDPDAAT